MISAAPAPIHMIIYKCVSLSPVTVFPKRVPHTIIAYVSISDTCVLLTEWSAVLLYFWANLLSTSIVSSANIAALLHRIIYRNGHNVL